MRILAIECAHPPGSISLHLDGKLLGQLELDSPSRTTEQFASAIATVLKNAECPPGEVQFAAAHIGPGSFTGLRIGVTAAKSFSYAVGGRVVGINTLHTIADQAKDFVRTNRAKYDGVRIEAVMDAQRGQVFRARFAMHDNRLECVRETEIANSDDWLNSLSLGMVVSGTGLRKLKDQLPEHVTMVPTNLWKPRAETLGRLALAAISQGADLSPLELQPNYFRKSAAEEKAEQPNSLT